MAIKEFKMSVRKITGVNKQVYPRVDAKADVIDILTEVKVANENNPAINSEQWIDQMIGGNYSGPFQSSVVIRYNGEKIEGKLTCAQTGYRHPQFGITISNRSVLYRELLPLAIAASEHKLSPSKMTVRWDTTAGILDILSIDSNHEILAIKQSFDAAIQSLRNRVEKSCANNNKPDKSEKDELVYFALDRSGTLCKIGVSGNVSQRLSGLNSGNPGTQLLKTVRGNRALEQSYKTKFSHLKLNPEKRAGEWFHYCRELQEFIRTLP
jgi:hypothetical protein